MNVLNSGPTDQQHSKADTFPPCVKAFQFGKNLRLLDSVQFSAVFADAPIRASHPNILILARVNTLGRPRLGLVVAKKHVRKACKRNEIKRVTRESFRLQQHNLPPIDAIVLARSGADSVSAEAMSTIINGLWKRIIKRAKNQHNSN